MFLVSSYGDISNAMLPFNLTNCPGTTLYTKKKVQMQLATSRYPINLELTLHIMNDSGISIYTDHNLSIQVSRWKDLINEMVSGELHPVIDKFFKEHKDWLNEILIQLPEAWTELDILPYLQEKLHALQGERDESQKAEKMNPDARAQKLAYHLWKTAFDARNKSDGLQRIIKLGQCRNNWNFNFVRVYPQELLLCLHFSQLTLENLERTAYLKAGLEHGCLCPEFPRIVGRAIGK